MFSQAFRKTAAGILLAILLPVGSFAADDRVQLSVKRFTHLGQSYDLVSIDIDPDRWDQKPSSSREIFRRHFADRLMREVHSFLDLRHRREGKSENSSPLDRMILQSFERFPDPAGRLEWSDSGRSAHKVDDYFEHRTLVLFVQKTGQSGADAIVGTVKFVMGSKDRMLSPLLSEYRDFIPAAFAFASENEEGTSTSIEVEYENLARAESGPSPIPLLFETTLKSEFFRFAHDTQTPSHTTLNAQDHVVAFHEKFGFTIDHLYYQGQPAKRMRADTRIFLQNMGHYVRDKMARRPESTLMMTASSELAWDAYVTERAKNAPPADTLFCHQLLVGR